MTKNKRISIDYLEGLDLKELNNLIKHKEKITYVNLCKRIGLKYLYGNSKKNQLRELGYICVFKKEGHNIKFLKLKDKNDIVLENQQLKYSYLIEKLLINYLLTNTEDQMCFFTTNQLIEYIGLANKNFTCIKNKKDTWFKRGAIYRYHKNEFTSRELTIFLSKLYPIIFKPILIKAFNTINNKGILTIQKGYKGIIINDENYFIINIHPDSKDNLLFKQISEECLKSMGIENYQKLFLSGNGQINQYFKNCSQLCKERTQYAGFYECYVVTLNKREISLYDTNEMKKEINKKVIKRILNNKMFEELSVKGRANLIELFISIDTQYDLLQEYLEYKKSKEGIK